MKIKRTGCFGSAFGFTNTLVNLYTVPAGRVAIVRFDTGSISNFSGYIGGNRINGISSNAKINGIVLTAGETIGFMNGDASSSQYAAVMGEEFEMESFEDQFYTFTAAVTTTLTQLYLNNTGRTLFMSVLSGGTFGNFRMDIYQADGNSYTIFNAGGGAQSRIMTRIILKPGDRLVGNAGGNMNLRFQGQGRLAT